jgi:hypothetical protein
VEPPHAKYSRTIGAARTAADGVGEREHVGSTCSQRD